MTTRKEGSLTVENTTEEILASFEKFKSVDHTPANVEGILPSNVISTNGCLTVWDKTGHCEKFALTDRRKEVLKLVKNNPGKTQTEIAEMIDCGGSVVSRTIRNFDFLLQNDSLYNAYVKGNFEYVDHSEKEESESSGQSEKEAMLESDDYYKIVKSLVLNDEDELAKKILSISP